MNKKYYSVTDLGYGFFVVQKKFNSEYKLIHEKGEEFLPELMPEENVLTKFSKFSYGYALLQFKGKQAFYMDRFGKALTYKNSTRVIDGENGSQPFSEGFAFVFVCLMAFKFIIIKPDGSIFYTLKVANHSREFKNGFTIIQERSDIYLLNTNKRKLYLGKDYTQIKNSIPKIVEKLQGLKGFIFMEICG